MGIDAKILLRISGPAPSEDQIKLWSWDLCNVIGADKFFINREEGQTAIQLSEQRYRDANSPAPGTIMYQDGPDIIAKDGEVFLEVFLWTRYYGIGYERGDLNTICNVAEWCERNIPNCEVWYGGDSSGVELEPFPKDARDALRAHLLSPQGRDYFNYSLNRTEPAHLIPDRSTCKLCVPDRAPRKYGYGQEYAAYFCPGCSYRFITKDGGKTWTHEKDEAI